MAGMEFISKSIENTKKFAGEFLNELPKNGKRASVVGLHGSLGAGKTAFVQCVAEILGVDEHVTSPTFVILKNYKLQTKNYKLLIHIDAYRLTKGEELQKLGFGELLSNPQNLIFVEWPEHVKEALPTDYTKLHFEFVDETTRRIQFGIKN